MILFSHSHPVRILFGFLLAGASVCHLPAQPAPPPEVAVASPTRGEIHRYVTLPGTLRAEQQVTLHAKMPGYVKSIAVDRGDLAKAGQVLVELEMPEQIAARARYDAEVAVAEMDLARLQTARAKAPDLITPQSSEAAEARVAIARARRAENESLLAYGRIVAPFDGVVTQRNVDIGAFVPAATAAGSSAASMLTLMDFSTVRARVAVPEIEASRIQLGQPVILTGDGLSGQEFRGKVSRHGGALDEATRSLLVEIDLPNTDRRLRPGMYVTIRVGVEKHSTALLIPATALVREKAAGFVFLLNDGKAVRTPVKFGFNDGRQVEIVEGLPETASVLIPGKVVLVNGQSVTPMEAR